MFGQGLNIFGVKPNQISNNLNQYSFIIQSTSGEGKSTSLFKMLTSIAPEGKQVLFLFFEDRFANIPGIMKVKINNINDIMTVTQQLCTPQAKEMFSCVVIDTLDVCSDLISSYIASQKGVATVSEVSFGKGNELVKSMGNFIGDIRRSGLPVHFCVQSEVSTNFATSKEQIVVKTNKALWKDAITQCYASFLLECNPVTGERTLTAKRTERTPHLKDTIGFPDKFKVDDFKSELEKALLKLGNGKLVNEQTSGEEVKDTRDFNTIKTEVKKIGQELYAKGLGNECSVIMKQVLGTNDDGSAVGLETISSLQIDTMEMLGIKLKELQSK